MKFLLSIIAVCLIMITAKLYLPEASAEVDGMDSYDLRTDYDFREAVEDVVEDCSVYGEIHDLEWKIRNNSLIELWDGRIRC